jgi:tripartite-type tricarboxylate transporter receptor subunit TctC
MRYLTRLAALGLVIAVLAQGAPARAEDYPARPVTIVVPYAAGGGLDLIARLLGQKLSDKIGQSFVIENRLGAGGVIAANSVAKAPADGYTIFAGSSTQLAIQVRLHKKLPYDPATDFVPLALVASVPFVLIVNPSLPVRTAGDLIKLAKEKPGQLSFGSSGVGGPPHLYMELLKTMTGTQMTHIPYKGTAQAINDVVAGHVPILMSDVAPAVPLLKAGKVRALGVSSTTRVAALPDVPPIAENGVPGFDAVAWLMLVAPAATPKPIVDKLHDDLKSIVATSDTQHQLVELGVIPIESPPVAQMQAYVKSEIGRWGKVVEQAGIAGSE